jgi:DNA polymerase III subunit epsilon
MFFFQRIKDDLPEAARAYLQAPKISQKLAWREIDYQVLDIETSGLEAKKDVICAVGIVAIKGGRVRPGDSMYTMVRPPEGRRIDADSIRIHGLLHDDLLQAPPLIEVLPELLRRLTGQVLIVHVAAIDVVFLNQALKQAYGFQLRQPIIDTARLARSLHFTEQYLSSYGSSEGMPPPIALRTLANQANLPIYAQHNALNDAMTTAQLFLAQVHRMDRQGTKNLRGLLRAGGG